MAINAFDTPIKFQYKPLGLEGFAEPLAEMQNKYDTVSNKVDELDFDISSLQKDGTASDEIIADLMAKRDQLAGSLSDTKNFREASKKLMKLNKEYTQNEDIKSIQSNAKQWQEADKKEQKRFDDGEISKTDLNEWRSVAMGEYQGFKSGSIKTQGRVANMDKELHDDVMSLASGAADQIERVAAKLGMDPSGLKVQMQELKHTYKDLGQMTREITNFIKTDDRYIEYFRESADYDWRSAKLSADGDESMMVRSAYGNELANTTSTLDYIDRLEKDGNAEEKAEAKRRKESGEYASLFQKADNIKASMDNGQMDPGVAKQLHENQYTNYKIGTVARAGSDLKDYRDYHLQNTFTNPVKASASGFGSGYGEGDELYDIANGTFTKRTYGHDITSKTLRDDLSTSRKKIDASFKTLDKIVHSSFNKLFDSPNRFVKSANLNNVASAISNSTDYNSFVTKMKELNSSVVDNATLKTLYDTAHTTNGKANLQKAIQELEPEVRKLKLVKSLEDRAKEEVKKTSEYKSQVSEKSSVEFPLEDGSMSLPNLFGQTEEQIQKNNEDLKYLSEVKGKVAKYLGEPTANKYSYSVSVETLSKALGYANVNAFLNSSDSKLNLFSGIIRDYNKMLTTKLDEKLKDMDFSSIFTISGTSKEANALKAQTNSFLSQIVNGGSGLEKLEPLFSGDNKNKPGFDENGTFIGKAGEAQLAGTEDGLFITTPITYTDADGNKAHTTASHKIPSNNNAWEKSMLRSIYKTSQSMSQVDIRDREMVSSQYFNNLHPSNTLNSNYASQVEVTKTTPITLYEYTDGSGIKMKVVKESQAEKWEEGKDATVSYKVMIKNNSGKWVYLLEDGKPISTKDVNGIKSKLGEAILKRELYPGM